jgi:photosystem II stability/assembly factor-like uncharacterized protein
MSATHRSHHDHTRHEQASNTLPLANGDITPTLFNSLEWRSIGPYRGGRSVAVVGDPIRSQVFYFGSTGGGVWKTMDGGVYWENISDAFFKRASVGAIAVAPSDPNVLFVGTGETTIRGNVSHGDGVYKSTDGGKTWVHMGLEDTRHIGKIRIHPQNPDLVYVAALGHAHGPNSERGVYRSRDGGKTWERILFVSEDVGSHDLAMDPNNPRILYAALWRARRMPHILQSGGEGCGLFKSTDGGDTWTEITRKQGLPTGAVGKIGVAVSGARPDRVWAIIEAEDGAVFRSDDGGDTWQRLCEESDLRKRPWYYQHIYADPQDAETVWVLNEGCFKSNDGGRSFAKIATPHGDHHDLWIDPHNSQRIILGSDGGACVTFNGSETWSSLYNQPTAEFYHVTTDNQMPYRVYGAQQDNSTITVPSRSRLAAITLADYYEVGGGESGYIAVSPDDPNIVYAGSYLGYLTRYDHRSGQVRDISVWPETSLGWAASDAKYRFQWTFPILLSPHNPNVLYATGNHVFRSTDEGSSWEEISPDLTRNDKSRMESSGGPITKDNVGTEYYGTIFAFTESPLERGLFWAGSDDGLVHISRDGGESWQDVTPQELPEWALISIIEPSPHDPATAYLAATRYKLDDFRPYLYKTNDYGKTWTRITTGLADNDFTRVIREDPVRRGLLYAGTETGVSISFDDGEHWSALKLNLPAVPIHDLVIKDSDLVVATHGRSFWILDDISPLRQLSSDVREATVHLFAPRPTTRFVSSGGWGHAKSSGINYRYTGAFIVAYRQQEKPGDRKVDKYLDAGQNPPEGVVVHYYLKEKPEGEVTLSFLDANGKEIRTFSSEEKKPEQSEAEVPRSGGKEKKDEKKEPLVLKEAGGNRFVWNMRYPDPSKIEGYEDSGEFLQGPLAPPGTYQVQLKVGDHTSTAVFQIHKDPHIAATQQDLQAQFELLLAIRDKISEAHSTINAIRDIRRQVEGWERNTKGHDVQETVTTIGKQIKQKLASIEEELFQVKAKDQLDVLDFPIKLSAKLIALAGVVSSADAAPTRQAQMVFEELSARVDELRQQLHKLIATDVAVFNKHISDASLPAIVPVASMQEKRV